MQIRALTRNQRKVLSRHEKISREYKELIDNGASRGQGIRQLMNKYGLTDGGIRKILKSTNVYEYRFEI